MSLAHLGSEWERLNQKPAPDIGADLLSRSFAYRMQEQQYGGLTTTARRQIIKLAKQLGNCTEVSVSPHSELKPRTRLSRDWHGKTCHLLVMDDGFLFEGLRYRRCHKLQTRSPALNGQVQGSLAWRIVKALVPNQSTLVPISDRQRANSAGRG